MIDLLTQALYALSNALIVPDIVALLALFVLTVVHLGGFAAEALDRQRRGGAMRALVASLRADPTRRLRVEELPTAYGLPGRALAQHSADRDKLLDDLQLESEGLLGRLQLGVRLAPLLGLVGTLAPLGPALMALSSGDVATLSSRLVIAFSSTVLGLVIGGACYAMHAVRARWYTRDLNDVEFIFRRLS